MKTARDRGIEWLNAIFHPLAYGPPDMDGQKKLINAVEKLLKEQDKITRHACADGISNITDELDGGMVNANDAHKACMNVKAV